MTRSILIGFFALIVIAVPAGPAAWGNPGPVVDHSIYGELLKKFVRNGVVNYAGFKSNEATISFLNNPRNYRLVGNRLNVSRIFKWFAEDFKEGVFSFYLQYATGTLKKELETRQDKISVTYLEYDWSLNGQ